MMEIINNYTTRVCSEYSNHSMQIFSLDRIEVSIVGFKRSKARRTIKIKLRLSKESETREKDLYKWVTYDSLYDYLHNNAAIYIVKGSTKSNGFHTILYNNVFKELKNNR